MTRPLEAIFVGHREYNGARWSLKNDADAIWMLDSEPRVKCMGKKLWISESSLISM